MKVIWKYYTILDKGLENLRMWVSVGVPEPIPGTSREDCMDIDISELFHDRFLCIQKRIEDYIPNSEIIVINFKWCNCGQFVSLDFLTFSKYPKCITYRPGGILKSYFQNKC